MTTDTNNNVEQTDARDAAKREDRKWTFKRVVFYLTYIGGGALLLLPATLGVLVSTNLWLSVIWFVPVLLLLTPILYAVVAYATVEQTLARFGPAAIAALVMFVSFLLIIFSGLADNWFGFVVGNETMGQRGLTGTLTWLFIGMILSFALAFVLPVFLFARLVRTLIQVDVPMRKMLLLAFFAPLSFALAIGMSIIMNSGW